MPILEVKNLYKNFGSTKVLKDISFSLERGKALAIIGLVLQLAGAGGLMPVQMLSAPLFQEIYPWLPFAHSMPALEGAMAGIYGDQYLVQMGLLAAILVPSLILGLVLRRPVIRLNDWVLAKLNETKFL